MPRTVRVSPEQVRAFRVRRSGLFDPFASAESAAQKLVGIQAQLAPAAQLALWNRVRSVTPEKLDKARLSKRSLVRFWGPRNTMHLFKTADWPWLHTLLAPRQAVMLRKFEKAGLLQDFRKLTARIGKRLEGGEGLTYKDVRAKALQAKTDAWVIAYAAFMQLVREGACCHGPERGGETCFVHREHWCGDLRWQPPEPDAAFAKLVDRYLAAYGPAEIRDLAFWYGTTVTEAKGWVESAGARCRTVDVEGRELLVRTTDVDDLARKAPAAADWPLRLLYRFDPLLLATKDKDWLIDPAHYKRVWRAAAHVEAVLLVRGRIAGTWRYDKRAKGLRVKLTPFARLSRSNQRAVEAQAAGVAAFFGLELDGVEIL